MLYHLQTHWGTGAASRRLRTFHGLSFHDELLEASIIALRRSDVSEVLITITLDLLFFLCDRELHLHETTRSFWGE